mmetsp:Transcript_79870/g.166050  ORF Transcript_79870/g.166050 Transcript_79870/m.166050 type:complete len:216 (-) Transcript_79870:190-837(-)
MRPIRCRSRREVRKNKTMTSRWRRRFLLLPTTARQKSRCKSRRKGKCLAALSRSPSPTNRARGAPSGIGPFWNQTCRTSRRPTKTRRPLQSWILSTARTKAPLVVPALRSLANRPPQLDELLCSLPPVCSPPSSASHRQAVFFPSQTSSTPGHAGGSKRLRVQRYLLLPPRSRHRTLHRKWQPWPPQETRWRTRGRIPSQQARESVKPRASRLQA